MNILNQLVALERESADFGFKWESSAQILKQIFSEVHETMVHVKDSNRVKLQEEIGDLMHAIFSLCVFEGFDPEGTLSNSIYKYERRFRKVKELAKNEGLQTLQGQSSECLMKFWDLAKLSVG